MNSESNVMKSAPFGSWQSPITASLITSTGVSLSQPCLAGERLYWLEGRPLEAGRYAIVGAPLATLDSELSTTHEVFPSSFNARTRVHEYGGGSYWADESSVYFTNFADQRLYRVEAGGAPEPITPEPEQTAALRYADGRVVPEKVWPGGPWMICVRERHVAEREPVNELVALPTDGSQAPTVIASGHDFYAAPRLSPNGRALAFITWDHPRMPWDGTTLWVAALTEDGTISTPEAIAGGESESVIQPSWSPEGVLHFLSDRSGFWNLYTARPADAAAAPDGTYEIAPVMPIEAELGGPQWAFGPSSYAFLSRGRIACAYARTDDVARLGIINPGDGEGAATLERAPLPYSVWHGLTSDGDEQLFFVAASPTEAAALICYDLAEGSHQVLKRSLTLDIDDAYLSLPQPIEFPTDGDRSAYALYYAPASRDFQGPSDERPPLIVMSHGGPTAATSGGLNLAIQFWTSRGFAVVDVNYSGSSGYGRAYRERLRGQWGVADTADCIAASRYLADSGQVDGARMAIRGGSAGGYTTLCALVFHDVFAAGASYYGVADLEGLAKETHKFESRYLDGLIGPYPERADLYRERSPVHFLDRLSCPVIILQGLEDKVVPPSQADAMVAALDAKQLPYAYVPFPGEQHGFRKAENIQRALESELSFYAQIFGFEPAGEITPVAVTHLS